MLKKKKNSGILVVTKEKNKSISEINKSKGLGRINASKQIGYNKRMLVKYLIAGYSVEDASLKLKIKKKLASKWLRQPEVAEYLERKMSETLNIESKKRRNKYEFLHSEIYDALMEKVVTGHIKKMSTKNLLKVFNEISREMREEDPKSPSKNINHKVTLSASEELVKLYDSANSKKFLDSPSLNDKIVEIDMPAPRESSIKKEQIDDAEIQDV